jgi:hypothetical protein
MQHREKCNTQNKFCKNLGHLGPNNICGHGTSDCYLPVLTQELQPWQVSVPHHLLWREPDSPVQIMDRLHPPWTKLVAKGTERKVHLYLLGAEPEC